MENKAELKESELSKLSAGIDEDTSVHTKMECSEVTCGYKIEWIGNYVNQIEICPGCGKLTFKGMYLIEQDN